MNPLIQFEKICLVCVVVLACYGLSPALNANTITVTNTNDSGPGSLREALAVAIDGDTIDARGISGTILLTTGELQVAHTVRIKGPGAGNLAVDGNATSRVFENFASSVTISGFTITNGNSSEGGGILNHGGLTVSDSIVSSSQCPAGGVGGGICNLPGATLKVIGSTINGNHCSCLGGGIYTRNAQLTVVNSTISDNKTGLLFWCETAGGGIYYDGAGTVTVTNSVISRNDDGSSGGGISGGAIGSVGVTTTVSVKDSTISGNSAHAGGGIYKAGGRLTVTNSTISGNQAPPRGTGAGGGIWNAMGALVVTNSTISGNQASLGGGIVNTAPGNFIVTNSTFSNNSINNSGSTRIGDTVLKSTPIFNYFGPLVGTVTSLGYNLASHNGGGFLTGPGDQINTDPMLGPLRDNGGRTFTQALLPGSPAINAGNPNFTPPPDFDQRGPGYPRVVNGRIDIGSFEVQITPTPTPTPP